jgi:hypothetical protein
MTPEERFERHERWLEEHDRMMADLDGGWNGSMLVWKPCWNPVHVPTSA